MTLGGLDDMPFTNGLLRAGGTSFNNGLVTTPICCPSRTALLSGQYGHNLAEQQIDDWCGDFTGHPIENATWITRLFENGYRTQMSGKYHNAPPQAPHVPLGWTDWFSLNNECQYYNNSFNDNGKTVVFGNKPSDYMTSLIGNRSLAFVRGALADGAPFLAYVAPHASHMPTTVAPWYENATIKTTRAPRTPQYNASGAGKHWVLADQPPIPLGGVLEAGIDEIFAARHRALLSVDDIVRELAAAVDAAGRMDSTFWIYASDHGYNLGTFRLPVEKFHMLESDIHVPFLVRGPGVPAGAASSLVVTQIDIGATILDLAGLPPAATPTDGRSFAQALGRPGPPTPGHRAAAGRDRSVIEYGRWGTGYIVRGACQLGCGECSAPLSRLVDAPSDTYSALRIVNATHDISYAEFSPNASVPLAASSTNWTEAYDLAADPWQLRNLALEPAFAPLMAQLSSELWAVAACKGAACP